MHVCTCVCMCVCHCLVCCSYEKTSTHATKYVVQQRKGKNNEQGKNEAKDKRVWRKERLHIPVLSNANARLLHTLHIKTKKVTTNQVEGGKVWDKTAAVCTAGVTGSLTPLLLLELSMPDKGRRRHGKRGGSTGRGERHKRVMNVHARLYGRLV